MDTKFAYDPSQELGSGCTRRAYVARHDPRKVVKIAKTIEGEEENRKEYRMWRRGSSALRRYLARSYAVSACGKYLLIERTRRPKDNAELAAMREATFPSFLTQDAHAGNIGVLDDGRIVLHDYAFTGQSGLTPKRSPYL
jgi:hypothetical protein